MKSQPKSRERQRAVMKTQDARPEGPTDLKSVGPKAPGGGFSTKGLKIPMSDVQKGSPVVMNMKISGRRPLEKPNRTLNIEVNKQLHQPRAPEKGSGINIAMAMSNEAIRIIGICVVIYLFYASGELGALIRYIPELFRLFR